MSFKCKECDKEFDTGLISECKYNEDSSKNEEVNSGKSNNEEGDELWQSLLVTILSRTHTKIYKKTSQNKSNNSNQHLLVQNDTYNDKHNTTIYHKMI